MPLFRRWPRAFFVLLASLVVVAGTPTALLAQPSPPASTAASVPVSQPASQPASQEARPRLVVYDWGPGAATQAAGYLVAQLATLHRFSLAERPAVVAKLREAPAAKAAPAKAAAAVDEGRGHETRLAWGLAELAYRRALAAYQVGLTRLFEPQAVAPVHFALGAVAFLRGQREQADREFRQTLELHPGFVPEKSYAPQVRSAFDKVREQRQRAAPGGEPPPPPTPKELTRVCQVVDADAVILVEHEAAVGRRALRGSLFVCARHAYVAVETRALAGREAPTRDETAALGGRLAEALDAIFPPPPVRLPPIIVRPPPPPPPPPPPWYAHWYRKWWVWTAVGVVAATSIAVPIIVLREDTVDLVLRY